MCPRIHLTSSLTKRVVTIQGGDLPVHTLGALGRDRNVHLTDSPIGCPAPQPLVACATRHPHESILLGIPYAQAVSLWKVLLHKCRESKPPHLCFPSGGVSGSSSRSSAGIKPPRNSICCKAQGSEQRGRVVWKRQTAAISLLKKVSGEMISKG